MPRIAYLDIIGGISGDMLLAAMLDAGLDKTVLERELGKIVPDPFEIRIKMTTRGATPATHADVALGKQAKHHLAWDDFYGFIEDSSLPEADCVKIKAVFDCLQNAEAEAHDAPVGDTHLHELGTLDTLIDIAGAVIGQRLLGVERLYASPFPVSIGMSSSSHGKAASIAPATMAIIKKAQIPTHIGGTHPPEGECITPTGAAIVATLSTFETANMTIDTVGYGAGTRNTDTPPNVVGMWLGQSRESQSPLEQAAANIGVKYQTDVVLIEANLDDMTGEEIGHAVQSLFDAGAVDVWTTPIQMKKSRPAVILSAIARECDLECVSATFFEHSSTLGVRVRNLERLIADRKVVEVETEYGTVRVKLRIVDEIVTRAAPEYDDCARIASALGLPLATVMDAANRAAAEYRVNSENRREA